MDNIISVNKPSDIERSSRLFTCDKYHVDRIFTPDSEYILCIYYFDSTTDKHYYNYIYFTDITSMFCMIDLLSKHI